YHQILPIPRKERSRSCWRRKSRVRRLKGQTRRFSRRLEWRVWSSHCSNSGLRFLLRRPKPHVQRSRRSPMRWSTRFEWRRLPAERLGVTIKFNTKALEGLHVQISQHEGELVVHRETQSKKVSQLLAKNIGALNQNLTNQGYQGGVIDTPPPQRASFERGREN